MAVNPEHLAKDVTDALKQFCETRVADPAKLEKFQNQLEDDFRIELNRAA